MGVINLSPSWSCVRWSASLSIAPGVGQWRPARSELVLYRGTKIVNIEVVSVEPQQIPVVHASTRGTLLGDRLNFGLSNRDHL